MTALDTIREKSRICDHWTGSAVIGAWPAELDAFFPLSAMRAAQDEIINWDGYGATELKNLDQISDMAGVDTVLYKDESTRFGLGSFKALGGAYAVLHYIAERLTRETGLPVSLAEVRSGKFARQAAAITVVTATDGNHGRSVAWGAKQAGCRCRIYIHAGVSEGREKAMAEFGAEVIRIRGDYDESVRLAASEADENGWQVISDTSYEGYMEVPRQVMAGYTVMVREILEQMEQAPTHVIVQAGVGGLAAAICAAFWAELGDQRPKFIITESEHAACILQSMKNNAASRVEIENETIMAGLSCGEISLIAWEILSRGASAVVTLPDEMVAPAMRYMASLGIEAGECAVPGILTLLALSKDAGLMSELEMGPHSRVLVFGCEGATDPDLYRQITEGNA